MTVAQSIPINTIPTLPSVPANEVPLAPDVDASVDFIQTVFGSGGTPGVRYQSRLVIWLSTPVTEEREASTGGKLFRRAYALINIEGQLQPGPLPHLNQKYPFIETGFSAVARAALPSFFPAVFRWELQPIPLDSEMVLNSMVYGIR